MQKFRIINYLLIFYFTADLKFQKIFNYQFKMNSDRFHADTSATKLDIKKVVKILTEIKGLKE